jgi:hypothetical protein
VRITPSQTLLFLGGGNIHDLIDKPLEFDLLLPSDSMEVFQNVTEKRGL